MKKTQPIVTMPTPAKQTSSLTVTSTTPEPASKQLSMDLCWALLAVSALILIIQIWNYFV